MDSYVKKSLRSLKKYKKYVTEEEYLSAKHYLHRYLEDAAGENPLLKRHSYLRIYPLAAIYQVKLDADSPQALEEVTTYFNELFVFPAQKQIRIIMKLPFLHRLIPLGIKKSITTGFGEGAGFQSQVHVMKSDQAIFDIVKCPYFNICTRLGIPELTDVFCTSDDLCYERMHPQVDFLRKGTIGRGDDLCDFNFTLRKK